LLLAIALLVLEPSLLRQRDVVVAEGDAAASGGADLGIRLDVGDGQGQ